MKKIILLVFLFCLPLVVALLFKKEEEIKKPEENKEKEEITIKVMYEDNSINEINLEDYLIGVLGGEMPVSFPLEALKAQAVASRTYVLYQKEHNTKEYDVLNTTTNQVYKDQEQLKQVWNENYDQNIAKIKQAIEQTKGEIMVYNDEIIDALFFSTAPGYTENSEDVFSSSMPYLRSVESNWDKNAPNYESTKSFSLEEFKNLLGLNSVSNIVVGELSNTGRTKTLIIDNVTLKANDIRNKLSLRSTYFDYDIKDNTITFTTYGYGHGVGMSQYGAKYMAEEGYSYQEILNHYYTDIKIIKSV